MEEIIKKQLEGLNSQRMELIAYIENVNENNSNAYTKISTIENQIAKIDQEVMNLIMLTTNK